MNIIFPEQHELLWLFECEPELLDKDETIPLYYNLMTFHIERLGFEIYCSFQPSCGDLDLTILQNSNKIIDFHVTRIVAVRVKKEQEKEFLAIDFQDQTTLKTLYLYLKPFVQLSWSMDMSFGL